MKSPIYWHPFFYTLLMRILYGRDFQKRYLLVAEQIGSQSVLDVCCGDCFLANYIAKDKYHGVDINAQFIDIGRKKGLCVSRLDVVSDDWPVMDCVVILASLYQFIPEHEGLLKKAFSTARKRVVISEPIKNLADSKNKFIAGIARFSTNPGVTSSKARFNRESLMKLYKDYNATKIIDVGRELVGVFDINYKRSES